jgi:hypothetical protein
MIIGALTLNLYLVLYTVHIYSNEINTFGKRIARQIQHNHSTEFVSALL